MTSSGPAFGQSGLAAPTGFSHIRLTALRKRQYEYRIPNTKYRIPDPRSEKAFGILKILNNFDLPSDTLASKTKSGMYYSHRGIIQNTVTSLLPPFSTFINVRTSEPQVTPPLCCQFLNSSTGAMANYPIQKKSHVTSNNGEILTEIISTTYTDRHFVVISQMKKLGTLIDTWAETKADGGKTFNMVTLLGRRDDPLLNVYARQLVERISMVSDKPLLLAIALKPNGRDTETFQSVLNEIVNCNSWQP